MISCSRLARVPAALFLLLLAAGCATAASTAEAPSDGAPPAAASVEGVADAMETRDRMVAAMRRPGHVYHRLSQRRQDAGIFSNEGTISHWLDADAGLAREALRLVLDVREAATPGAETAPDGSTVAPPVDAPATVIPEALPGKPDRMGTAAALIAATQEAADGDVDDGLLRGDKIVVGRRLFDLDKGLRVTGEEESPACPGLSAAISLVLGCRPGTTPVWTVEAGRYRGQQALVLTASYRVDGEDEPVQVDNFYLDPATYLPWGLTEESVINYGGPERSAVRADFTHAFIPAADLPDGIFDPTLASEPTPTR